MTPERVIIHIDQTIIERINSGQRWDDIIGYLSENIERYVKRDSFIKVSESYLVKNWERIEWKKRMTTMLVIQSTRRINDIKWIKENHYRFQQYGSVKMYKLISLKDKLNYNKI